MRRRRANPNPNPNPNPSPNPNQDYSAEEEGSEWRWPAFTTTATAVASDEDHEAAVEVAAHFESDDEYDEGGEHEAGGSDSEMSEGGSRRPIFIRRPCGRGPNGKEWEGDTGPHHSPLTTHHSPLTAQP